MIIKLTVEAIYMSYTEEELKISYDHLNRLDHLQKGSGDELCEMHKIHLEAIKNELKIREIKV